MIPNLFKSLLLLTLFSTITAFAMDTQPTEAEAVEAFNELSTFMRKHAGTRLSDEKMAQIEKTIATHKEYINTKLGTTRTLLGSALVAAQPEIVRLLLFHNADLTNTWIYEDTIDDRTLAPALAMCHPTDMDSFKIILEADKNAEQTVNSLMIVSPREIAYPLHGMLLYIRQKFFLSSHDTLIHTDRILKDKLCWLMHYGANPYITYPANAPLPYPIVKKGSLFGKNIFFVAKHMTKHMSEQDKEDIMAILNKDETNEKSYYRNFMISIDHDVQPLGKKRDNCVIS